MAITKEPNTQIQTLDQNGYRYVSTQVKVSGNLWTIMQVFGPRPYVAVRKDTNNPFRNPLGKEFRSFDDAARVYTSPEMKTALLMVETNFLPYKP